MVFPRPKSKKTKKKGISDDSGSDAEFGLDDIGPARDRPGKFLSTSSFLTPQLKHKFEKGITKKYRYTH